jgi:hypothetical protein
MLRGLVLIFPEVWVADFVCTLRQKARWSRAFCLETVVGVPQPDT